MEPAEDHILSLQELSLTEASLAKLAETDTAFTEALQRIREQIEERTRTATQEIITADTELSAHAVADLLSQSLVSVLPEAKKYVPPTEYREFARYLADIRLVDFVKDDGKGETVEIKFLLGDAGLQLQLLRTLSAQASADTINVRISSLIIPDTFYIDIAKGSFDMESFKSALKTNFFQVGGYARNLSRKSGFVPKKENDPTKPRVPHPDDLLYNEPNESGRRNTEAFFRWIREDLAANHPLVTIICAEKYLANENPGFYPSLGAILHESGEIPSAFRRRDLPRIVSVILGKAMVDDAAPVSLWQNIEDSPFETVLHRAMEQQGSSQNITQSLRTRVLNRLRAANTFLSEPLIHSVVGTFIEQGCPFDSIKDVTQQFLDDEFGTELKDLGLPRSNNFVSVIRKLISGEDICFPCDAEIIKQRVGEAIQFAGMERAQNSEALELALDSFANLIPFSRTLDGVRNEDRAYILKKIHERVGDPQRKITPKRLNEIVDSMREHMPAYFAEPTSVGIGGKASGASGRVFRGTNSLGG